jgi:predicted small lipoprotein YifL
MIRRAAIAVGMLVTVAACGPGEFGEADYVAACKAAHGMDDALCACTAREAKARLSPEAWKIFVLQAQGKTDEASDVALRMTVVDQGKMISATLDIATACGAKGTAP